jgi:glutaredoxin
MEIMQVRIYGKRGCHLCLEAAHLLDRLRPEWQFEVEYIDIEEDADLRDKFRCQIPVITFNGGQRVALRVTEARLRRALKLASQRQRA